MFNLKGPQGQTRGPLVVRGPQFEKRWASDCARHCSMDVC